MPETLTPLQIPPGFVRNGTLRDRAGRWINGNLVRFSGGVPKPWGSWSAITTTAVPPGGVPAAAYAWFSAPHATVYVAVATTGASPKLYVIKRSITNETHTLTNITPASGFGVGGAETFGYAFANYGQKLLVTSTSIVASPIFVWDPVVGGLATSLTADNEAIGHGVFVSPERYVMNLFSGQDVNWADQNNIAEWTPLSTNTAGGLTLPSDSNTVVGQAVGAQTLVWTHEDLWVLNYLGGDLIYGAERAGSKCGVVGSGCVSVEGSTARWMGSNGFFEYDGYVRPLECPVSDYVFGDMNRVYGHRFFQVTLPEQNEIIWFYLSSGQNNTPNRYVSYNYAENVWATGDLARAAGVSSWPANIIATGSPTTNVPLLFDPNGTTIYRHENTVAATGAFIESGPIELGAGDQIMRIQKLIPDGAIAGDDVTLFTGTWPGVAESSTTSAVPVGLGPIDVRLNARYVRYKQTLENISSRVGIPRLGMIPSSRR
jgi:hypothetical protein